MSQLSTGFSLKKIAGYNDKLNSSKTTTHSQLNTQNNDFENMFDIISELGCGSYGTVFKVNNKSTNETFGIKKIKIQGLLYLFDSI